MVSSKASALKRLKTSLKTAGIVGPSSRASTSKKDRKKGNPTYADVTRKLDIIKQQLNPFEVKTTRLKFDVLGRRVKGGVGKPGLTKQVGEDNRKKTLLVELNRRNKAGGLVDRRFGENDPTLTPEERMLERFAHERQKRARGGLQFNLEDDDDDEGLTHYGRSLAEIDDFEEGDLGMSDEDDKGTIDKQTVSRTHFGGFGDDSPPDDDDGRKKSKAEVMKEVIAKSKFFKYERQKEKEEDEDLRRELDDGLESIRDVLFGPTTSIGPGAPKRPSLPSQKRVFGRAEDEAVQARGEEEEEEEGEEDPDALNEDDMRTLQRAEEASRADVDEKKDDDYDRSVRELAFDRRARPQDRMKTEEEKAAEEKAKLEKLERMRKRRMEGMEDEEGEEKSGKGRKGKKQRRVPQADDLEDEFLEDEAEEEAERLGKGLTVEDIMNATGKENVAEEKGEEDKEGGEDEDWEEGGERDNGDEDSNEEYESDYEDLGLEGGVEEDNEGEEDDGEQDGDVLDVHPGKLVSKSSEKINPITLHKTSDGIRDLPYVFSCPRTYSEFASLLHTHSVRPQDIPLVVHRIRTLYHPKLAPDNLAKLLPFISILLDHVVLLASSSSSHMFPHAALAKLTRHVFELAQQMPERAVEVFLDKLKDMQAAFAMHQEVPGIREVIVLRILGQVFPTSDFRHPVVTPAMLFIGQCLEQGKVATEKDVARKVALAQVLYEYQSISKRFLPEPLNFLLSALVLLAPYPAFSSLSSVPGTFPLPDGPSSLRLERPELEPLPLDAAAMLGNEKKDYDRQQSRASLLWACARTVGSYAAMYASTTAFMEVFEPVVEVIKGVKVAGAGKWCKKMEDQLASLEATLTRQIGFAQDHRRKSPLQLQAHKPVPIATFVPKFEEGYSIDRHYDPDASRAQLAKLKHQYKRERKGAIRELRKDGMFVARERAKQRSDKDQQYKKMVTGVMTVLEGEQAEKKRLEREKAKEKRR